MNKLSVIIVAVFLVAAGCSAPAPDQQSGISTNEPSQSDSSGNETVEVKSIVPPIDRASERITKKPFGLEVSPRNSPVQPEKFTGFHTGVDFEAFEDEQNSDVQIYAICDGELVTKRSASGYGGLVTQQCTIENEPVTVLYGHVRLSSVQAEIGTELKAGENLGVLGTGYSAETDNERKHLHLGIVKGHGAEIRGYVPDAQRLGNFLDITKYY